MKLLIVNNATGWGGLEMNVVKLALELRNEGLEIHIACQENTMFDKVISEHFPQALRLKRVKKYFDFSNSSILANYIKNHQIEKVFTAYRPDLDVLMWTKRKVRSIEIIHQQHMQIGIPKKGLIQRMRYNAVDLWLTPLEWLKQEVLEKTSLRESKIRIVPIGVRLDPFLAEQPKREDAQTFFSVKTDAFLIGVIGRIDEKKGQLFLVKAVQKIREKGENVELLIVGTPTIDDPKSVVYHQALMDYITDHQLQDVIHFAPFTKEIIQFYNAIDLFVMSSEGETYGMVTIEAMLAKTPVLGTNSSGTPEVLGHGRRGRLYTFNQLDSFLEAYATLRRDLNSGNLNLEEVKQEVMNTYSLELEIKGIKSALNE